VSLMARFVIEGAVVKNQDQYLETRGVNFNFLIEMQNLGIISGAESIGIIKTYRTVVSDKFIHPLRSNGKVILVESYDATKELKLDVYLLTKMGAQLMGLGSFEPDVEYLRLVAKNIAAQGFSVRLADWKQVSENQGQYFNSQEIDA